jgi:hypothetical protein
MRGVFVTGRDGRIGNDRSCFPFAVDPPGDAPNTQVRRPEMHLVSLFCPPVSSQRHWTPALSFRRHLRPGQFWRVLTGEHNGDEH